MYRLAEKSKYIGLFLVIFLILFESNWFVQFFGLPDSVPTHLLISAIESVIILSILLPLTAWLNRRIISVFFPQENNLLLRLTEFDAGIEESIDALDIFEKGMAFLEEVYNPVSYVVFFERDENVFAVNRSKGIPYQDIDNLRLDIDDPFITYLLGLQELSVIDMSNAQAIHSPFLQRLMELRIDFVLPLKSQSALFGAIALGRGHMEQVRPKIQQRIFAQTAFILSQHLLHARLYQNAKRESIEKGILLEIGQTIASHKSLRDILNKIIDAVAEIVPFDAAGIFIVNEYQEDIPLGICRGYEANVLDKVHNKIDDGVVGWCLKTGRGEILDDVTKDDRYLNVRAATQSEMVVPIQIGDRLIGAFNLESDHLRHFTGHHYQLLKSFASQAALVIENARLFFAQQKSKKIDQDMALASSIQQSLLPKSIPEIPGYDISCQHTNLEAIGGDLYDVFRLPNGKIGMAIGDATGKGIPAAILMATIFATYRGGVRRDMTPNALMETMNNIFAEMTTADHFVTFFYGLLDPVTHQLEYTNAGHNPPILLRTDGTIHKLKQGGTVLGFFPNLQYDTGTVSLAKGDILILYTDGVTEAHYQDEEYGEQRLINHVKLSAELPVHKLSHSIFDQVRHFTASEKFEDDITMLIIKRMPGDM